MRKKRVHVLTGASASRLDLKTPGRIVKILYYYDRSFTSRITEARELNKYAIRHASRAGVNTSKNPASHRAADYNFFAAKIRQNLPKLCRNEQKFVHFTHHGDV
jgi:hypothetical protein